MMKFAFPLAATLILMSTSFATVIPSEKQYVISLDGNWRFKLEQAKGNYESKGEKPKLPIDYPQEFEPFYKSDYTENADWHDIKVPGNWEMAGFSPATYNQSDNASGFYRLSFDVPKEWAGRIVRINFDGVQNGAEIWLNGQPVKVDEPSWGRENYHEGGWTAFQVDLTPAVKFGEKNLLALRVTKNTKSADMDTGDYFFLGGVHRPVTLFSVPKTHIDDVTIQTKLLPDSQAEVKLIAQVTNGQGATVEMPIEGLEGPVVGGKVAADGRVEMIRRIGDAKLWSAESPRLYTANIELRDAQGQTIERVTKRIGIREVTIKDAVFLLNGVPIKMAGICRHDVSPADGTAVGPDVWRKDIELMKAANINAIRTSHYPYGAGFYDLCDELGMYVIDELPYCWTPTNDVEMDPAFLQRARETIRRDKNHPSVLVWTIGNENKEGRELQSVADLVKKLDPTRPRNVSQIDGAKYGVELTDSHYMLPPRMEQTAKTAKNTGRPHIHLENPNTWDIRLGADAGGWVAWAPVLQRCWDVVMREETIPGTFLWEWQDRAVADNSPTKMYWHFPETNINLLKIKGVVDGFRDPRPWYWDIKMIYSPVQVGAELKRGGSDGEASFDVENRYSFTNLSQLKTHWQLLAGRKSVASGDAKVEVSPRSKGSVTLKLPDAAARDADALRVDFDDASGRNVVSHQFTLKQPPLPAISKSLPERLAFPQFSLITRVTKHDKALWRVVTRFPAKLANAKDAPAALSDGAKLDADIVMADAPDKVVGRAHAEFTGGRFSYRIEWSGPTAEVQELGWLFTMPKEFDTFSWNRQARWTVYPDGHIARPVGSAHPDSMDVPVTRMNRPDAFDFNSTKYDCDFASLTDASGHGLAVQFDKDHRHHCRAARAESGSYMLAVNKQVSPPDDISTKVVRDLYLTLNKGDVLEGSFAVGSR